MYFPFQHRVQISNLVIGRLSVTELYPLTKSVRSNVGEQSLGAPFTIFSRICHKPYAAALKDEIHDNFGLVNGAAGTHECYHVLVTMLPEPPHGGKTLDDNQIRLSFVHSVPVVDEE